MNVSAAAMKSKLFADQEEEQTFDPRPKWALVPEFFAPGTRNTFSPGWRLQPGLKVPAQRLLRQTKMAGTFIPGWSHQPGLKVPLYIPAVSFFLPEPELSTF